MKWIKGRTSRGFVVICCSCLYAQVGIQQARSPEGHLMLRIIQPQGDTAVHRTNALYPDDIVLAVTDVEGRPIPGADVEFSVPNSLASAVLPKNPSSCSQIGPNNRDHVTPSDSYGTCIKTDLQGTARIGGLRANKIAGPFHMRVRASFGGESTEYAEINERNESPPFLARNKKKLLILAAASAAVVITVVLKRPSSPPSVTIGTVTGTGPVGP